MGRTCLFSCKIRTLQRLTTFKINASKLFLKLLGTPTQLVTAKAKQKPWKRCLPGINSVQVDYSKASVILSLDNDFLSTEAGDVPSTAAFTKNRTVETSADNLNRLYAVESKFSLTGAKADHRIALRQAEITDFVFALVNELSGKYPQLKALKTSNFTARPADVEKVKVLAKDLVAHGRNSLVVAGESCDFAVHAAVASINEMLGAVGNTVTYSKVPTNYSASDIYGDIKDLVAAINAGAVNTLVTIEANPVYDAPADLKFEEALAKVTNRVHYGLFSDETAAKCQWHLNAAHSLESWGAWIAANGAITVQQPMILPLTQVVRGSEVIGGGDYAYSPAEFLVKLMGDGEVLDDNGNALTADGYEIFKGFAASVGVTAATDLKKAIHSGFLIDTIFSTAKPKANIAAAGQKVAGLTPTPALNATSKEFEVVFTFDNKIGDGRFANNAWLQELPDPMTKVTWDNPVLVSKATADLLGVDNEDQVKITLKSGASAEGVIYVMPGQATGSITVTLGYGRSFDGSKGIVGRGVGHNFYGLRTSQNLSYVSGATVTVTGTKYPLADSQPRDVQFGRGLSKKFDKYTFDNDPKRAQRDVLNDVPENMRVKFDPLVKTASQEKLSRVKSMAEPQDYSEGYQWGMTIDLTKCTSCAACTVACQSENNIPVVGKNEVRGGREMHWIRMDRYFTYGGEDRLKQSGFETLEYGDDDSKVGVSTMPVACQQCENAPCEQVCPVAATTHSPEGLNDMTYNRCIGTRYCANNCPYKVRRFNFYHWSIKSPWTKEDKRDDAEWRDGQGWDFDHRPGYSHLDKLDRMQANPHVTVRSRGVMEKCTYCTQRINVARMDAKGQGKKVSEANGNLPSPACADACPADAIVFGDINDQSSTVAKKRLLDHSYGMLEALGTRPRTTYISAITNPNKNWPK